MNITPQTGSYAASFPVSLVIDGHGDVFNAAQATVTLSNTVKITDLVLGDCNFSFIKTPSTTDPSFEGAILGTSSKKCAVYTLTLSPIAKGNAQVTVTKATVKRYGDAAEVLSSHQDGSYIITGTTGAVTKATQAQQTTIPTPSNGLYTVVIKVLSSDNAPVNQASVNLVTVAGSTPLAATTDTKGTAQFPNIKSGVYSISIVKQNRELAKNILNVAGPNHILTLSINIKTQQDNPLLKMQSLQKSTLPIFVVIGVLVIGVLAGVVITLLPRLLKRSKKAEA